MPDYTALPKNRIAILHGQRVEVLAVWTGSRGLRAEVLALDGQRFNSWTHGGWCESNSTHVNLDWLTYPPDECHCVLPEQSCQTCRSSANNTYGDEYND